MSETNCQLQARATSLSRGYMFWSERAGPYLAAPVFSGEQTTSKADAPPDSLEPPCLALCNDSVGVTVGIPLMPAPRTGNDLLQISVTWCPAQRVSRPLT